MRGVMILFNSNVIPLPGIDDLSSYLCDGEEWLDEIDITNDYMFAHVMRDPDICKEMLEYLLPEHNIQRIEYVSDEEKSETGEQNQNIKSDTQKTISNLFSKRAVRLDAYLDDGKTIYDIEMQAVSRSYMPQRVRLYQSQIDISQLNKGEPFEKFRPSYVIFICKFDPFGDGQYRYTFRNRCDENKVLTRNDGAYKIFFNTAGYRGNISRRLKELLKYMNDTAGYDTENTDVALIKKIEETVRASKRDERRQENMMMALKYKLDIAEARAEGRTEAKTKMIKNMLSENIDINLIAKISELSVYEINAIASETDRADDIRQNQ